MPPETLLIVYGFSRYCPGRKSSGKSFWHEKKLLEEKLLFLPLHFYNVRIAKFLCSSLFSSVIFNPCHHKSQCAPCCFRGNGEEKEICLTCVALCSLITIIHGGQKSRTRTHLVFRSWPTSQSTKIRRLFSPPPTAIRSLFLGRRRLLSRSSLTLDDREAI